MSGFGQSLIGNVNCGTANPLMQMAGQMQGMGAQLSDVRQFGGMDKGGQFGRPGMTQTDLLRAASLPQPQESSHFLQNFQQPMPANAMPLHLQQQAHHHALQQQHQRPAPMGPDPLLEQFMAMELQNKEMERFQQAFPQQPPQQQQGGEKWAQDFAAQQHGSQIPMRQQQRPQHPQYMSQQNMMTMQHRLGPMMGHMPMMGMGMMGGMGMGMGMGMNMGMSQYAPQMPPVATASTATVKEIPDNATEEEVDNIFANPDGSYDEAYKIATENGEAWADEFATQQQPPVNSGGGLAGGMDKEMLSKLMHSDNPKWRNSKFLKFIDKISKGQIEFRDNQAIERPGPLAENGEEYADPMYGEANAHQAAADWNDEFSIQQNHPASWSDQYGAQQDGAQESKTQAEQFLDDYMESGEADTEFKDFNWQQALEQAKEGLSERKDPEYKPQENNPFQQSVDPFADGVKLFKEGKIKESILAFEATVQKQPDHADAWCYLGEAQAQSEEESNAIAAFLQCVAIDPYNLKALLQLGVSYTNDLEEHRALGYLKTWMQNNPDYQGAVARQNEEINKYMEMYGGNANSQYTYDSTLHDEVTKMFLNALSVRPDDADLHTVLGVLYHISSDFDKAIEAFKNAVKLKPDDPALWNKLGATQANSSRSGEAVHAYQRALQLRPAYVRALANLAISYANQGLHEDAVRTYLTTLHFNPDANHVWSYLRISLSHLQRDELVELSHVSQTTVTDRTVL